jgi:hypothetical protein
MPKKRRVYISRVVGNQVMTSADLERLHKYMLEIEGIDHISDEMRAVVEEEWPELAHKLPPKKPHGPHGPIILRRKRRRVKQELWSRQILEPFVYALFACLCVCKSTMERQAPLWAFVTLDEIRVRHRGRIAACA